MNGRLNWKDILVILGVLVVIIGTQWGFSSSLSARIERLETRIDSTDNHIIRVGTQLSAQSKTLDRMNRIETELSAQGKALARIEGRLNPYQPTHGAADGG